MRILFLLVLVWWEVSSLKSHQVHLSCLGVTCNLFYVPSSRLWRLNLLSKLTHLVCWKLLQIYIGMMDGFGKTSSSLRKNHKLSQCKILSVSDGYLARDTWAWTALYHSSTEWLACVKLVSRANLALTLLVCNLQESLSLAQITSNLRSSVSKHHDTYWSNPKSPLHIMTFLHL